ncbi:MAG: hypothetical protein HYZ93_03275 [Candidatus Omnitrophica bacterium]|nr:hypothetical protein [Candidatus Omnitrophota bacterium]
MAVRAVALLLLAACSLQPAPAFASVKQEVTVTATVASFGGYTFTDSVEFTVTRPGKQQVGKIVVDGLYNGEYPWVMRVYTDNQQLSGVTGLGQRPNPAGLISRDGRFSLPIEIRSLFLGENVSRRIPDLNEPKYTDCIVMGIDPRNASWVAGGDRILFTEDDNPLGDTTVRAPFELSLWVDASASSVKGAYEGTLYIEIVPAP